ncbi:MAG TPA: alpha/beta hydrolase [Ktedonobacteraceae bacterium]|nr:alpha/beta hydrolase [Ktedonobacteraceae bacterium]
MKGLPFKRHLVILFTCLLAIGVIVPIATFAKGTPSGEQKRAQSHVVFAAVAGQSTPVTADCSSPQPLVTLQKGDTLQLSATLTSTDPNEQSEGEFLQVFDNITSPPTNLVNLDNNTGSTSITHIATANGENITTCIIGIDIDDTGTVTFTVTPANNKTFPNLVILLQGIDSSFPTKDPNLASVGPTLKGLPSFTPATTQFVNYSYSGSDPKTGAPLPYACTSTFTNTILRDILRLNDQIKRAAAHFGSTNIYLVGHSLGGVVAFGYMALLEEHSNGVALPTGAKLKAVVTLDSPIGGVAGAIYTFFSKVIATTSLGIPGYPCPGMKMLSTFRTFDDLVRIYDSPNTNGGTTPPSDAGTDPQGARASIFAIAGVTNPTPNLPFLPSNDFVAGFAHTDLGTAILTIGNIHDYLWYPNAGSCEAIYTGAGGLLLGGVALLIPDFRSTQFLEDQGDNSGHYGRAFDSNNPCIIAFANTFNHLDVLKAANVQIGLRHFFVSLGQTPTPLKVNPFQS